MHLRWRWKEPEFEAVRIVAGGLWPAGVQVCESRCDPTVIARVLLDRWWQDIHDGDWVIRYRGETEVWTDEDLRKQAVCLED